MDQPITRAEHISIHALREEGDGVNDRTFTARRTYFNPRPPRGGRHISLHTFTDSSRISIHALREEGDISVHPSCSKIGLISIHALREEGDTSFAISVVMAARFQSTPSARRATISGHCDRLTCRISIHALREEGDSCLSCSSTVICHFNPRPPRGGRRSPIKKSGL